ncbi:MAG: hypothetical protein FK732_01475 [Asgard group archaeon]|nr:hypothetical protein [Asgard group archaeon]
MKFTIHTETKNQFNTALNSKCDGIRFGSEFCEFKIPDKKIVEQAYLDAMNADKNFAYVIPLLSNRGLEKIRKQTHFLSTIEEIEIITGDLGVTNLIQDNNKIRLGRTRVYIPGRSPWSQITRLPNPSFFTKRKVEKLFYQTNLNYKRTLEFYKNLSITGADVDWIPKCFKNYKDIVKKGFRLAIHTFGIPSATTMRCHTARFMDLLEADECSKPCLNDFYIIKQKEVNKNFLLQGNVVFQQIESKKKDIKKLVNIGIDEIIIPIGAISNLYTSQEVDEAITNLQIGV